MENIPSFTSGVPTANGLTLPTDGDLLALQGYRLSDQYIQNIRKRSPISLFLDLDTDIDICKPTAYATEGNNCSTGFTDTVLGSGAKATTWNNKPTIKKFHGYRQMERVYKLHKDQIECMNKDELIMREWNREVVVGIEDGKDSILAMFTNHLMANAVHSKNTGNGNAGLGWGGQYLGTPTEPLEFSPSGSHRVINSLSEVIKQMPNSSMPLNEFGSTRDDKFLYGHTSLEGVLQNTPEYNSWQLIGDCAGCNMFSDVFDKKPRGFMPITSDCVESRICESAGKDRIVTPILFGKRYMGTKAGIKIDTDSWESENGDWTYFRTTIKYNIHTYDCRYMGLAWVSIENENPTVLGACK